ncbi:protein-serine O-palmitoleoyltransferase porcupine-like [Onthophagus taurus]|uniref:protein-serine O-palmitoleoyltransferase porcupine-like n=1 Tax=Onthophagus taurus TaxID=166361 RepID=UPI0039BE64F1
MMIMTMKTISISMEEYFIKRTTCAELMGYLLSPATVLFGPWISLETYTIYYIRHMKLNWKWAVKIAELFNYAMIHLALINYFDAYLIPVLTIRSWNVAFIVPKVTQNAFAFRASNYYVGYMAEFTMITAGFNAYHHFDPQQRWRYPVTRALTVEFPRSMDVAVQNWNIPAYHFLVQNIYSPFAEINKTSAVLMSFLVTMLIHGLNIRTTVVLLSLGIWTYTQEIIQDKLAMRLSSCCRIYACRAGCGHRLKFWHPITLVINGINMFLNILHLVFTGHIMHKDFDGSTVWDLCRIWRHDFGLLSHLIIVIWFCFMLYVA